MTKKLTLDRELLVSKLAKAYKFVPTKVIIPAWDNFKMTVTNSTMEIVASDGNIQIKMYCPVTSSSNFSFCVPAGLLLKTVSLFKENEVTITQKSDTKIELKSGKSKYNITLDCLPDGFTTMPIENVKSEIAVNQFMLNMALKSAKEFVDEKHPNANFSAINIAEINNKIICTGATRFLICRAAISPIAINSWSPVNIPVETAKKVISLLGEKGEIGVCHSGDKIKFFTSVDSSDYFEVMSVTANIKFPNTEGLLSKKPTDCISVNTLEFKDAIRRLSLYSSIGEEPIVHVSNTHNSQELRLTSNDNTTGKDGEELISINNPTNVILDKSYNNETIVKLLSEIDDNETNIFFLSGDSAQPSFMIPKVNTEEENIYSFLIASIKSI